MALTKLEISAIRQRMKRFGYRDLREAIADLNKLMEELDSTRTMLAKVCAKCPRDMDEANEARRMLDL